MRDFWLRLWQERPGALVGGGVGIVWSLLAVQIGFFAAVFVLIAGVVGWYIGTRYDFESADWGGFLERFFPRDRD
jgi:uncharacterized membrane protein